MKLFVAKLNRDVQDEHLEEAFSAFGPVAYTRVITDRDTGQSKCFRLCSDAGSCRWPKSIGGNERRRTDGVSYGGQGSGRPGKKAIGFPLQRTASLGRSRGPYPLGFASSGFLASSRFSIGIQPAGFSCSPPESRGARKQSPPRRVNSKQTRIFMRTVRSPQN